MAAEHRGRFSGWPVAAVAGLLLALGLLLTTAPARAQNTENVQVRLPVAPQMDLTGVRRILVGGFLTSADSRVDLQRELVRLLRTDLKKNTDFLIMDDPPVNLPEQRLEDLKVNDLFFAAVGEEYRADLIISGQILYDTADRSGFAQEEYISPMSGRRSVRTSYQERTGFNLRLDLIFLNGQTGDLLYDTTFYQDEIVSGDSVDPLSVFYALTERFRERFLGILAPRERYETRFLFTE